jgi:hypothetical protein
LVWILLSKRRRIMIDTAAVQGSSPGEIQGSRAAAIQADEALLNLDQRLQLLLGVHGHLVLLWLCCSQQDTSRHLLLGYNVLPTFLKIAADKLAYIYPLLNLL